jgi:hypothetical protein
VFCFRSVFNGLGEIDVRAYAFALAYILTCYSVFLLSFFLSFARRVEFRDELVVPETSEGCTIVRPRSLVNDSDNSSTSAVISNASMKERFGSGFNGEAQRTKKHSLLSVGVLDDVGRESAYEAISEKVSGLSIYDNHDKDKDDYDANGLTRTNNNTTNNYDQSSNRNADEETITTTTNNNSSNYRQPLYSLLDDDDPPPPPSTPPHYNNEQYSSLKRDDSINGVPTYDFVQSAASIEFRPSVVRAQPPTSTLANLDHQKLDKRLEHYGLKEFIVKGDGNCQFRAISDQLYNDQSHHASVRATTIAQMRNNRDRYAAFVEAPENGGFDAYLRDMSRDSAWGDHVTLQAAADAFGVPMCVITSYKDNFVIEIQPDRVKRNDRALWISFWSEVHYNSLYPIESSKFKNVHVGQR